jgi:hypothetical protein
MVRSILANHRRLHTSNMSDVWPHPPPLNFPWAKAPGSVAEALYNYSSIGLEDNFGWFPQRRIY